MNNVELARAITHMLIRKGRVRDSEFSAVSRLVKELLDEQRKELA